jgi:hypothetical protein
VVVNLKKKTTDAEIDHDVGCPSYVAVGNFVYITGNEDDIIQVDLVDITDLSTLPVFGVVISKYSSTFCKVRVAGEITTTQNLVVGKRYFIDEAGLLTLSVPDAPLGGSAAVQFVGYSTGVNKLVIVLDQVVLVKTG